MPTMPETSPAGRPRVALPLVHLSMFLGFIIVPLVVFLTAREDRDLREASAKAFDFQVTTFLIGVGVQVVIIATAVLELGVVLLVVLAMFAAVIVAATVMCVTAALTSFHGQEVAYPISLRLLQRQARTGDVSPSPLGSGTARG